MSDSPHSVDDLASLTPGARAARYRQLAEMHLKFAREVRDPAMRGSHLQLASLWTRLASAAEHGGAISQTPGATPSETRLDS